MEAWIMRLQQGDQARPFSAFDLQGHEIELNSSLKKPLLLSFFRTAACPLCSLRLWYYATKANEWRTHGLRVVAIFESTPDVTADYCKGINAPFPLVPDPEGKLFRLYDVTQSAFGAGLGLWRDLVSIPQLRQRHLSIIPFVGKGMFRMPADFLIAPDFTVTDAHYGRDAGDHIALEKIDQFSRTLHTTVPRTPQVKASVARKELRK
jgi:thioredoxin-dependent peroxiredoxin